MGRVFSVLLAVVACGDETNIDSDAGAGGTGGAPGQGGQGPCISGTCVGGAGAGAGGEGGGLRETAVYAARNPGPGVGVPHFSVTKAVPERDVCITISVAGVDGGGGLEISANAPWTVGYVVITQDASQCEGNALASNPGTVAATAAAGTLLVEVTNRTCDVDVHAVIEFQPDAPWVPLAEPFDVDDLPVSGGCE